MKKMQFKLLALTLLSALTPQPSIVLAQGSLTPPGAPAPTMKTLAQIEPRTPISALPFTISSPGAYYVTTNLAGVSGASGITIAANDVGLDLKGFSLLGVPGSIDGIVVSGNRTNLWIGNGTVRGWGLDGIDALNSQSSRFTDLTVVGSGNTGLRPGPTAFVARCSSIANAQEGFLAFDHCYLSQCSARNNGAAGISAGNDCRITDCQAQFNNFDGVAAGSGCSISGCTSANNVNSGMSTGPGCTIIHCVAANNNNGILAGAYSSIGVCTTLANTNSGISAGSGCSISHCTAANNNNGILAGADNSINSCTALANTNFGISLSANCVVAASDASGNAYIGISIQGANSVAKSCVASSNLTGGIVLYGRYSTVEGCTASGNAFVGIQFNADGCLVLNNTCDSNGSGIGGNAGIACFSSTSGRIEANHFSNNSHNGLYVDAGSTHNIIARNVAVTNSVQTSSYNVSAANNDVGPIGRAATATSPWANLQY